MAILILLICLPLAAIMAGVLQGLLGSKIGKSRTPVAIISYILLVFLAFILFG